MSEADGTLAAGAPHCRDMRGLVHRSAERVSTLVDALTHAQSRRVGSDSRRRRWIQASQLDDASDHDRGGGGPARADRRTQARREDRGSPRDPHPRAAQRRRPRDGRRGRAREGRGRRQLQIELAASPEALGEGLRLVRREWPTDIGPVDLMCRDAEDGWLAVEIKRVATIEAVEQLTRYLERIRIDPAMTECAASSPPSSSSRRQSPSPKRGDPVRRGRPRGAARRAEPELTLFAPV